MAARYLGPPPPWPKGPRNLWFHCGWIPKSRYQTHRPTPPSSLLFGAGLRRASVELESFAVVAAVVAAAAATGVQVVLPAVLAALAASHPPIVGLQGRRLAAGSHQSPLLPRGHPPPLGLLRPPPWRHTYVVVVFLGIDLSHGPHKSYTPGKTAHCIWI